MRCKCSTYRDVKATTTAVPTETLRASLSSAVLEEGDIHPVQWTCLTGVVPLSRDGHMR